MPIYLVKIENKAVLVDANSKAAAINHVTRDLVEAKTLTPRDVVDWMQKNGPHVEKVQSTQTAEEQKDAA